MLKTRYYYNSTTCSYEPVKITILTRLARICSFCSFSILLAVGMIKYGGFFISPRERALLEDNAQLKEYYHMVAKKMEASLTLLATLQNKDDNIYRCLLNVDPLSVTERDAGMGGAKKKYGHLTQHGLISATLEKVDQLQRKLTIQQKSYSQVLNLAEQRRRRYKFLPTLPPISSANLKRISAAYGMRMHPIHRILKMHEGVDFAARVGTPVFAPADGRVKCVKHDPRGYGHNLLLDHGSEFQSRYAHMNTILVKPGQLVYRGQQIGTVGNSGASTAPHLHYEVYQNRRPVDPLKYFSGELTPAQYEAVRKQAAKSAQTLCAHY